MLLVTRSLENVSVREDGRESVVKTRAHPDTMGLAVKKSVQREVTATEHVTT